MTFRIDNRQIGGEIGLHIPSGLEAQDGHIGNASRNVNMATMEEDVEDRQEDAEDTEERRDAVEPIIETKKEVRIVFKMHESIFNCIVLLFWLMQNCAPITQG